MILPCGRESFFNKSWWMLTQMFAGTVETSYVVVLINKEQNAFALSFLFQEINFHHFLICSNELAILTITGSYMNG
jgi:hypothetical protein